MRSWYWPLTLRAAHATKAAKVDKGLDSHGHLWNSPPLKGKLVAVLLWWQADLFWCHPIFVDNMSLINRLEVQWQNAQVLWKLNGRWKWLSTDGRSHVLHYLTHLFFFPLPCKVSRIVTTSLGFRWVMINSPFFIPCGFTQLKHLLLLILGSCFTQNNLYLAINLHKKDIEDNVNCCNKQTPSSTAIVGVYLLVMESPKWLLLLHRNYLLRKKSKTQVWLLFS